MKFVIDTNILLSALIKDSKTRKILMESGLTFYYPEISFKEVEKYKGLVMEKADINESDFNGLVDSLLQYIKVVSRIDSHKIEEAEEIIGQIDPNDVTFIALALSIENDGIWSNDAHFQKQDKIKVYKTEDIINLVEKEA